jgi:outer membrane protein assembly factor BamB
VARARAAGARDRFGGRVVVGAIVVALAFATACSGGHDRHGRRAPHPRPASAYGPGWSTVHADGRNTNDAPVHGPRRVTLAWQRRFDGTINLGATFDRDGRVYVTTGGSGCHLHVLDPRTGNEIWCSEQVDRFAVVSSALLDREGRAFLADGRAMRAFDHDGRVLWETPIVGVPLSAQFTPDGRLLFVTNIGRVYVLRRDTGAPMLPPLELIPGATFDPAAGLGACARGTAACPSANTLAVDPATGRFFFTFWAPGVKQAGVRAMRYSEDPKPELDALWTHDNLPGGSASSPTLSGDATRVYVTDDVDSLHALDASTGREIWTFRIGYAAGGGVSLAPNGVIMPAGGGLGGLMAIADTGTAARAIWQRPDAVNRGIATQAGGGVAYATVAVAARENDLVVVDTTSGAELDRERLAGISVFTVGTTVALDGTVFVPTLLGQLYAFRPA